MCISTCTEVHWDVQHGPRHVIPLLPVVFFIYVCLFCSNIPDGMMSSKFLAVTNRHQAFPSLSFTKNYVEFVETYGGLWWLMWSHGSVQVVSKWSARTKIVFNCILTELLWSTRTDCLTSAGWRTFWTFWTFLTSPAGNDSIYWASLPVKIITRARHETCLSVPGLLWLLPTESSRYIARPSYLEQNITLLIVGTLLGIHKQC